MEQIYQTYLNIIKNICTDSNDPVSVTPEQFPALANLAQEHCTVPFVLPCLRSAYCLSFHEAPGKRNDAELLSDRTFYPGLPYLS